MDPTRPRPPRAGAPARNSGTIVMTPELPLSPEYYRRFFEEAPVGLALCRMEDGSFVAVNQAFADILGQTVEATMKLEYWHVTPQKYEALEQVQLRLLKEKGAY